MQNPFQRRKVAVVILPKTARCCRGRLLLSLPPDFRQAPKQKGLYTFIGEKSGLRLNVMQLPFRRHVRSLSPMDLQIAFRRLIPPEVVPTISYGFLRHSPTMTAVWQAPLRYEKTVLHLIQVRRTVFLLLFEYVNKENENHIQPMLANITVRMPQ